MSPGAVCSRQGLFAPTAPLEGLQISDAAAGKAVPIRLGVTKVVTPGLLHLRPVETNPQLFERATPAVEELTLYY